MIDKLIISGCSYSILGSDTHNDTNWVSLLKKKYLYNTIQLAVSGQSNGSITKKIYDLIIKHNPKNCLIICQLTYTHRIGAWHNIANSWLDYQPNYVNIIPEIDETTNRVIFPINYEENYWNKIYFKRKNINKEQYDELFNMYKTWLKYVYDEKQNFKELLFKIDTLESFVEKSGNKIMFIYWPEIISEDELNELKHRKFFNIDDEYSILKWSTINKLHDSTSHLSNDGNILFAKLIDNELLKRNYNLNKNINLI